MPTRPNLVFVRAGKNSLHRAWIEGDPARTWDCHVSFYDPGIQCALAEATSAGGQNKYEGFLEHSKLFPAVLSHYEYVFLIDDDIRFHPGDISRFFDYCRRFGADLAQPSLSYSSYWCWSVVLHNPMAMARRTNFVEVMMPCFSRRFLSKAIETFDLNKSTWGLEYAWDFIARREGFASYVFDCVIAAHTKEIDFKGGAFYRYLQSLGCDPHEDAAAMRRRFTPARLPSIETHGHIYRWPRLGILNRPLVAAFESIKWRRRVRRLIGLTAE